MTDQTVITEKQAREITGGRKPLVPVEYEEACKTGVTRENLDEQVGYKRSTRDAYLQRLSARKLIDKRGGRIFASAELFG